MSVAAATPTQTNSALAMGLVSSFNPDAFDPITEALIGAETITDLVAMRRELGTEPDQKLQLEMDRDPVGTMARIMLARDAKGYATTKDTLLAMGFSSAQLERHGVEAQRRAISELAAGWGTSGSVTGDDAIERQAMLENQCLDHAGGEG